MRTAVLIACITFFGAAPALAQSGPGANGRLDAYVCEGLPSPLRIEVQLLDDAPRYHGIRDSFVRRMKRDGTEIVAGAPLVLMLDIRTERRLPQRSERQIGEVNVGKDGGVSVRGKVWSNTSDSILGGRRPAAHQRAVNRLHVTALLSRRDDGRCVWHGEILHDLEDRNPDRAAQRIVPILAGAVGRAVQNEPVTVPD